MTESPSRTLTIADLVWPRELGGMARHAVLALAGTLLLWASAKIQVPFWPVPMTLQTAAVFLIGIAYGARLGTATLLLYLAEGAIGLPVFAGTPAKGIGLAYMMGPTGGYIVAFVIMVAITGWLADRRAPWTLLVAGMLVATAINYALGATWLAGFIGWEQAIALGVLPFLLGDLVKIALCAALGEAGLSALRRRLAA